jgi:DnaJ-class molecular chaperone
MNEVSIVLCKQCEGRGYLLVETLVDYHKRIYDTSKTPCINCKGAGRLKKTTTVKYEPYVEEH